MSLLDHKNAVLRAFFPYLIFSLTLGKNSVKPLTFSMIQAAGLISANIEKVRCKKLCIAIQNILTRAIKYKGTTIIDFSYGRNEKGHFTKELKDFGRTNEPCTRCSVPITKIFVSQRGTHICKKCQSY